MYITGGYQISSRGNIFLLLKYYRIIRIFFNYNLIDLSRIKKTGFIMLWLFLIIFISDWCGSERFVEKFVVLRPLKINSPKLSYTSQNVQQNGNIKGCVRFTKLLHIKMNIFRKTSEHPLEHKTINVKRITVKFHIVVLPPIHKPIYQCQRKVSSYKPSRILAPYKGQAHI